MNDMTGVDLQVRVLDDGATGAWDGFVQDCPEATFFHLSGWRNVIEKSFGHACHFLYAERRGEILGVLPLTHVRSRLFGNSLVSNAFCVYGGCAAIDDRARVALDSRAQDLAESLDVDYLEYRNRRPMHPDWPCNDELYVDFQKELDPDPEKNMLAIPRKQRAMVRKGIKFDLQSSLDDDVERFFHVYATSVRNLGTPVFSRQYFRNLKQEFGDACQILMITKDNRSVSGVMSFVFRDDIHPYYGGGTTEARGLAANDFMYWEVMRRATEEGLRTFDFGRSKRGTGAFSFKKNWGFEPKSLHYEYKLLKRSELPSVTPSNPKYKLFIDMWRRLPLPVANTIGPHLARHFG